MVIFDGLVLEFEPGSKKDVFHVSITISLDFVSVCLLFNGCVTTRPGWMCEQKRCLQLQISERAQIVISNALNFTKTASSVVSLFCFSDRNVGHCDLCSSSPQRICSSGGRLVPAVCCRRDACSGGGVARPLCREAECPEVMPRGCGRVQCCHRSSAGSCTALSARNISLKGQGMNKICIYTCPILCLKHTVSLRFCLCCIVRYA